MPVPSSNPHDTQAAIAVLIALAACFCAARWRTTLRVLLIIVIALVVYGAILGFEGLTHVMTQLHGHLPGQNHAHAHG